MKLIFRVDATAESGAGHGMRCYALAEKAVQRRHSVVFLGSYSGFPWLIEKLTKITQEGRVKEIVIFTSCEAYGKQAEFTRYGMEFDRLFNNIDKPFMSMIC